MLKILLLLVISLCGNAVSAEALPKPRLSARDMYVSCYLFVHGVDVPKEEKDFNANSVLCGMLSVKAIVFQEGVGQKEAVPELLFCLPKRPEVRDNPGRAMAYAYMEYFEQSKSLVADMDGEGALLMAFARKWPCPK